MIKRNKLPLHQASFRLTSQRKTATRLNPNNLRFELRGKIQHQSSDEIQLRRRNDQHCTKKDQGKLCTSTSMKSHRTPNNQIHRFNYNHPPAR